MAARRVHCPDGVLWHAPGGAIGSSASSNTLFTRKLVASAGVAGGSAGRRSGSTSISPRRARFRAVTRAIRFIMLAPHGGGRGHAGGVGLHREPGSPRGGLGRAAGLGGGE